MFQLAGEPPQLSGASGAITGGWSLALIGNASGRLLGKTMPNQPHPSTRYTSRYIRRVGARYAGAVDLAKREVCCCYTRTQLIFAQPIIAATSSQHSRPGFLNVTARKEPPQGLGPAFRPMNPRAVLGFIPILELHLHSPHYLLDFT